MRASTRRPWVAALSGVLLAALPVAVPPDEARAQPAVTIVVAPDGDDANPGTEAAPLRTLMAAQQAVRDLSTIPDGGVSVLLRGGRYELPDTLAFDARDSGRAGHPVTWAAWPGERPVLDGGRLVDGWTVHDAAAGIWSAPAGGLTARQLYVDGVRATRARTETFAGTTSTDDTGHLTTDTAPLSWQRPEGVELVYRRIWTQPRNLVASVSQASDGRTRVTMAQPGWGYNRRKGGTATTTPPAWIENDYTFLDEPGEWYLDPVADTVYYIPREGEDLTTADVVLPAVERLVTVHGTAGQPVHDIVFDGLTFAHSTWLQPSGPLGGHPDIQGNLVRLPEPGQDNRVAPMLVTPGAVHLEYAHRVDVTDGTFTRLGNAAIDVARGSRDVAVARNRIEDIAGSGVQIGEVDLSDGSLTYDTTSPYDTRNYDPDDERDIIRGIDVTANHITRVGLDYASAVGVFAGYTQDVLIARNDLADLPYSAISLGWGWAQPQVLAGSIAGDNAIVGNSIRGAMATLKDGGAIYTLGGQPGTTIERNLVANSVLALYLDEGSSGIDVAQNVSTGSATLTLQQDFTNRPYPTGAFDNTVRETYWQGSSGPAADGVVSRLNGDNTLSGNVRVPAGTEWPAAADQIAREAGIPGTHWSVGDPYAVFHLTSTTGGLENGEAVMNLTARVARAANVDPDATVRWVLDAGPGLAGRTFTAGQSQITTDATGRAVFGTAQRFGDALDLQGMDGRVIPISGPVPAGTHQVRLGLADAAAPGTGALVWSAPHEVVVAPETVLFAEDFDTTATGSLPAGWTTTGTPGTAAVVADPDGTGRSLRIDHPATGSSSFTTQLPFAAQGGDLVLRLRMRAEQTTAIGYGPWLRDAAGVQGPMAAVLDDATFGVYRTNAWSGIGPYQAGRWYDLTLRIDVPAQRYSVAVDGVILATDVPFRGTTGDLALLQFGAYSGDTGRFHVDDIALSRIDT
ncbi:right-handed parallel beta-helix repeat-containing protein [Jiangella rhizosphaerae]|uniref:Right-handed parallel beta-helix repeat-containing protein n=1 Tax=Jiangella rhizosphaerae TaxID=2293569 RepID=A0A418KXP6_9ACTN|nr:right-handed parallel beta-helix repeat-containing protein [Jiangella rhizosphaerae]RIQ36701.1 right-handed parallel beta-helix repeat-containing protein [Jiangella rhizosphaerae]